MGTQKSNETLLASSPQSPTSGPPQKDVVAKPLSSSLDPMGFVSIRAIAIACALMPILAVWVVQSELVWYSGHSTAISLFFHVTFVLMLLSLLNLGIKKLWPSKAFSAGELMTIYMMLAIAGTFCSHDLLQVLMPMIHSPMYAGNVVNAWVTHVIPHLHKWTYVLGADAGVLRSFAVGSGSLYTWDAFQPWIAPVTFWFIFLMALMGALLSINIFFRKHWTEKERLSFPVIQIPMTIASDFGSLLRNKLFWLAFGLTAALDILNGFNFLYPSIPRIPIVEAFRFSDYFTERPWNAINATMINLFPFVIGLVFFIPTDLAFSCWFFFVIFKLELVVTSMIGIYDIPGFPFPAEQSGGGYIALGLLAIWVSRRHLYGVMRTLLGLRNGIDDSHEPVSYRVNFLIFFVSVAVLFFMSCYLLGASFWVMVVFFLIFFLYAIAIARIRAELGPPAHDLHNMGPDIIMMNALGARNLGTENMTVFNQFFWFNRAYRAHISAHSMEGFKIAQLTRITSRSMFIAMIVAVIIGALAAFWALLHVIYVHGYSGRVAGDAFSAEAWNRMVGWIASMQKPKFGATVATCIGLFFSLLLGFFENEIYLVALASCGLCNKYHLVNGKALVLHFPWMVCEDVDYSIWRCRCLS